MCDFVHLGWFVKEWLFHTWVLYLVITFFHHPGWSQVGNNNNQFRRHKQRPELRHLLQKMQLQSRNHGLFLGHLLHRGRFNIYNLVTCHAIQLLCLRSKCFFFVISVLPFACYLERYFFLFSLLYTKKRKNVEWSPRGTLAIVSSVPSFVNIDWLSSLSIIIIIIIIIITEKKEWKLSQL